MAEALPERPRGRYLARMTDTWRAGAPGVLRLPSGRLVRGRGLRHPLPPGVTVVAAKSKTRLKPTESEGHVVLKAAADAAAIADVPVSVVAYVSVNFVVKLGYSSPVVPLTVRKN